MYNTDNSKRGDGQHRDDQSFVQGQSFVGNVDSRTHLSSE